MEIRKRYISNDFEFFKLKGYTTLDEFTSYIVRLSAIVVRDEWTLIDIHSDDLPRNQVRTYSDARNPISNEFIATLRKM